MFINKNLKQMNLKLKNSTQNEVQKNLIKTKW